MSTHEGASANVTAGATAAPAPEPFVHGWRFVERVEPDGAVTVEQEPLTAEEALHPQEGDQVTESTLHDLWRGYLRDVFRAQVAGDPTIAVFSNVRVEWGTADIPPYGPDVAVMTGVRQQREWRTFDIAREAANPALIIEITSPSTATADRSTKLDAYERGGVATYVIVDAVGQRGRQHVRLVGFQLADGGYDVAQPDQRGWLWLAPVRVWLGIEQGRPRCYDEAGQPIPDYLEQAARIAALEMELRLARGERGPGPA
jgi:Uma2 family endonuclease